MCCKVTTQSTLCQEVTFMPDSNLFITFAERQAIGGLNFSENNLSDLCICGFDSSFVK